MSLNNSNSSDGSSSSSRGSGSRIGFSAGVSSISSSSEGYKSDEEMLDVSAVRALGPVLDQMSQSCKGGEVLGFQMTKLLLDELLKFYDSARNLGPSKSQGRLYHSVLLLTSFNFRCHHSILFWTRNGST